MKRLTFLSIRILLVHTTQVLIAVVVVVVTGRAGHLGLAISLVSTVPERVWYVKAKGYKPWLNPKPQDVKHNDEGGHTIWYNEPELLQVSSRFPP